MNLLFYKLSHSTGDENDEILRLLSEVIVLFETLPVSFSPRLIMYF